jgi:hypothetical protein
MNLLESHVYYRLICRVLNMKINHYCFSFSLDRLKRIIIIILLLTCTSSGVTDCLACDKKQDENKRYGINGTVQARVQLLDLIIVMHYIHHDVQAHVHN